MMPLKRAALVAAFLSSPVKAATVEAGSVTDVTVVASLYDLRAADDGGCDPAGCTATLTRDGDATTLDSRWSCKPDLWSGDADACSITYSLADEQTIESLEIAMYQGDQRARTMGVYVDDVLVTSWTSSGTTTDFENVDIGVAGQTVELRGVLESSEWLSIMEVGILVDDGSGDGGAVVEAGTLGTVTPTAVLYDPRLGNANGCDPAGCTAALTRDGDVSEGSRWSCASTLGGTCSISYDLGAVRDLSELRLAMYKGATRRRTVDVRVDSTLVTTWTSSGTTVNFEGIELSGYSGQHVTITGVLADMEWLSIVETEIMVRPAEANLAPAPTATPAPAPAQPVTPPSTTPGAVVQPVGLTPLAIGDGSNLERFASKDGDLGTSWTCTGDAREPNANGITYYECVLTFGLVYFRNVKQVKIALADGADRAVDMRISGRYNSDIAEKFVTSSGTTAGFETYDFDYKLSSVSIAAVFSGPQESITISEVEIVEEVVEGEVLINTFNTPYDNGDGLWNEPTTSGFEWSSDSDEAIGRTLYFGLAGYFTVTEMQLIFPAGDTFKFDLRISNDLDGTGEPYVTITDLESEDVAGWQSFDLTDYATGLVTGIAIVVQGRGSGAPGFAMLDANIMGTQTDNPTDTVYVGSTMIEHWDGDAYPDFVAEGTGDQHAINAAICAVKKATYDGTDCVGGDDTATGTVVLSFGAWYVDGSVVMKSGVLLKGWFSDDDAPNTTDIQLEESAAGNTDVEAIIVMDGISDAWIEDLWLRGQYDPDANNVPGPGFGPACLSVTNSQNITCEDIEIRFCDGDAMVVRDSQVVNIDAGRYDEEFHPWTIGRSRGTGLVVDASDHVWVRRHTLYDNGVAGIHIMGGSNNFTFEATVDSIGDEGEGNVGSLDGQQPIEIIIETSADVKFTDMRVQSLNDPVMTISDSTEVSFVRCGFSNVEAGTCTIQTDDPSTVTIDADEDELSLVGTCYVKV